MTVVHDNLEKTEAKMRAKDVSVYYGAKKAIDDVSIDMNGENIVEMDISEWTEPHKHVDGSRTKFTKAWASLPRRGHIGLQDHGGKLWFRNVKIRSV